jgi:hypothetical protein
VVNDRSPLHAVNPALLATVLLLVVYGSVVVRSAVSGDRLSDLQRMDGSAHHP